MAAWKRLQLLVGGFGEEQAARALELLSPIIGANARSDQQVRQLPASVDGGTNRSRRLRPWPFRPRPWAGPCASVDRAAPKSGAHGRIADGGRPKSRLG